ncbi:MAG TPA: hypothetical protein VI408_12640 [Gaiellaceae bacterium]
MSPLRLIALVVAIVAALSAALAFAAANTVPATRAGDVHVASIGPNELQPPECRSALGNTLTSIVTSANNVTLAHALYLGTSGNDTVKLKAGSTGNCLVGGAGTDAVTVPNGGTEVCIFDTASQKKPSNLGGCTTTVTRP